MGWGGIRTTNTDAGYEVVNIEVLKWNKKPQRKKTTRRSIRRRHEPDGSAGEEREEQGGTATRSA